MSELADDADLKSADCEVVWIQVPLSPPNFTLYQKGKTIYENQTLVS